MAPQDIAGGHVAIAVLTGITRTSRAHHPIPRIAGVVQLSLTGNSWVGQVGAVNASLAFIEVAKPRDEVEFRLGLLRARRKA